MKVALFFCALQSWGFALGSGLLMPRQSVFNAVSGTAFGAIIWLPLAVLLALFGFGESGTSFTLAVVSAIAVWYVVRNHRGSNGEARILSWFFGSLLVVFLTAMAAVTWDASTASYDSIQQIYVGRLLLLDPLRIPTGLSNWGLFLPILHGSALLVGVEYLAPLGTFFVLTTIFATIWFVWQVFEANWGSSRIGFGAIVFALALLATTPFFIFQAFYIHNSAPAAAFLLIGVGSFLMASLKKDSSWITVATLAMLGFAFSRIEAPVLGAAIMAIALSTPGLDYRMALRAATIVGVSVVLWYLVLFIVSDAHGAILTPARAIPIIIANSALIAIFWAPPRFGVLPFIYRYGVAVGLLVLGLAITVFTLSHTEAIAQSIGVLFANLLLEGRWGVSWYLLLPFLMLAPWLPGIRAERLFVGTVIGFFLLLVLFAAFRDPYRLGWGDSANRMIVYIFPVVVLYASLKIGALSTVAFGTAPTGQDACSSHVSVRRRLGSFALFAVTVAVFFGGLYDYSLSAKVLTAPTPSPPSHNATYGFDVALRPPDKTSYSAAHPTTGPATVIIDAGRRVDGILVDIEEYTEDHRVDDLEIYFSSDGNTWVPGKGVALNSYFGRGPLTRFFPTDAEKFRFVRLEARKYIGQQRLLLRRIRVMGKNPLISRIKSAIQGILN